MNNFGAFVHRSRLVFFTLGATHLVGCLQTPHTGPSDTDVSDTEPVDSDTEPVDTVLEVPGEYATIQDAVNAAYSGDTITVAAGVYHEDLVLEGTGVTLLGAGAVHTFIEGTGAGSVITLASTGTLWTLSGVTVMGGQQPDLGGGVLVSDAQLLIENSIIRGNSAQWGGAGVAAINGSHILMNHVVLAENETLEGPGGGLLLRDGKATLQNVRIIANHAWDFGGGIHLGEGANGWIGFVDLVGNTAWNGAGLYVEDGAGANVFAMGTAYNISEDEGGGWYLEGVGVAPSYVNFWENSPDDVGAGATPTATEHYAFFVEPFAVDGAVSGWDFELHLSEDSALIDAAESWQDPDDSTANLSSFGGANGGAWDLDGDGFSSWWRAGTCEPEAIVDSGLECNDYDAGDVPTQ